MRASELDNIPKHLKDFGSKKGTSFGGGLSPTIYAELVQAMQWTVRLLYSGGDRLKEKLCYIGF